MALDFPSSPSNGEVFGSYVWSSSKGVWQSREESAAPAVISPVPPTSPNNGDIWFDSSDGISYVYYDDGNTAQWVEMISSGVTSLALKADKTYVDFQDALKANIANPTFTGTITAETINASARLIGTTPPNSGSTGGLAVKAPSSGTQLSAYVQFVNNAFNAQWASIEATSSNELRLNASYVKAPSQPTFFAWQPEGVGTFIISSGKATFTSTLVNVGSNYNTSNGRFTAPTAGIYEFSAQMLLRSGSSNGEATFFKNDANVIGRNMSYSMPIGSNAHDPMHFTIFLSLAAGDFVDVRVSATTGDWYFGGGLGWFCGRLVG